MWSIKQDKAIDMRTAAYVHVLDRIAAAIQSHGTKALFNTS